MFARLSPLRGEVVVVVVVARLTIRPADEFPLMELATSPR